MVMMSSREAVEQAGLVVEVVGSLRTSSARHRQLLAAVEAGSRLECTRSLEVRIGFAQQEQEAHQSGRRGQNHCAPG